jgi:N-methylhydantoinase B
MLAVLSRRLDGIAARMQNTLLRTARSGVINNGRDFSCCILTGDARLITVGESLPIHVMVGPDLMARSMVEFHPRLRRGSSTTRRTTAAPIRRITRSWSR